MSKSTPAPPDWRGVAEETAAGDKALLDEQTRANRPDQYNPFGNTQWTQDDQGNWTQTQNLNEDSQRALDAQLKLQADRAELGSGMSGRLEEDFKDPMDFSNLPAYGDVPQAGQYGDVDTSGAEQRTSADELRQSSEDAIYGRSTSRLDPQWEQRTEQLEAKLVAQGLRPGDPAYDQALENQGRERTDAYQQASYGAIMGGGQEAQRQQGMQLAGREQDISQVLREGAYGRESGAQQFGEETSQSAQQTQRRMDTMKEEMTKRGFSLNEINAIISGQQVAMPNMEGFSGAGVTSGPDYTGAAGSQYGSDMDAYNAKQSWMNSMMSGLGMMGQAGINYSDRRLKRHISRVGEYLGYPLYLFQYIWGEWAVGVMADEVNSDAVIMTPSGYAAVDYGRIQ